MRSGGGAEELLALYLGNGKFIALILRMAGQTRLQWTTGVVGQEREEDCQTTRALHVCVGVGQGWCSPSSFALEFRVTVSKITYLFASRLFYDEWQDRRGDGDRQGRFQAKGKDVC